MMENEYEVEKSKFHPEILHAAISFARTAMQYGDANSYSRVQSLFNAYDAELGNEIMMLMLRRNDFNTISLKLTGNGYTVQKISAIKAIRALTSLGLKESKDISDEVEAGKTVRLPGEFTEVQRKQFIQDLVGTGYQAI